MEKRRSDVAHVTDGFMDYLELLVLILQMLYVYRLLIVAFPAKWMKNTSRGDGRLWGITYANPPV